MTADGPARALVAALREAGTSIVYGLPGGGSNLDVIGAAEAAGMRFVLTHTETAAVIMAAVTGGSTGSPGACVVTRGPGAASAVNGAAQALLDRQPLVLVTDCVHGADRDRVSHQRLDQSALFAPVTVATARLGAVGAAEVAGQVVAAATGTPPGPVHVDLDPTAEHSTFVAAPRVVVTGAAPAVSVDAALGLVRRSRRPLLVAGMGATGAAARALRRAVEGTGVPVLTTYRGRGAVPDDGPNAAGVMTGATIEAPALAGADLVIGVGLDPVELIPTPWVHPAPVLLLGEWPTVDSAYFGDRAVGEVVAPLPDALAAVAPALSDGWAPDEAAAALRRRAAAELLAAEPGGRADALTPQEVVTTLRDVAPPGTVATVDAGAHMLAAVPLWPAAEPGDVQVSSGLATMGFALPAAVAMALARPGRRVVCLTGDGGLGMVTAELETLARLRLPVTVVVFDDAALSLIAVKQRAEGHGGRGAVGFAPVDWSAVAAGFGVESASVTDVAGLRRAARWALSLPGPSVVSARVDPAGYRALLAAVRGERSAP